MNTEQKQRFLASYIGCEIKNMKTGKTIKSDFSSIWQCLSTDNDIRPQLTHPSKITDAHCVELWEIFNNEIKEHFEVKNKVSQAKTWYIKGQDLSIEESEIIISFLRNHAYIFQFEGMSIEELVESGVVELRNHLKCDECNWVGCRKDLKNESDFGYDQDCCPKCNNVLFDNLKGIDYTKF